jgi:hypothetical protein
MVVTSVFKKAVSCCLQDDLFTKNVFLLEVRQDTSELLLHSAIDLPRILYNNRDKTANGKGRLLCAKKGKQRA